MWLMDCNMQKTATVLPFYHFEFDLCDVDKIKEVPLSVFWGFLFWRPPQSATKDCLEQMGPINSCGSGIKWVFYVPMFDSPIVHF